jgi:lipopolysaccharide cholinephosphotransferase
VDIQSSILRNFRALHQFCENNGIKYYIIGGTLIGAVRHNGFIPWDDDIDIGMPRPDYDRFLKLADEFHNYSEGRYKVCHVKNDDGYFYQFAKSYDTQTTAIEAFMKPLVRGTWVDIFPIDGTFTNPFLRKLQHKIIEKIQVILFIKAGGCVPSKKPIKRKLQRVIHKLFPFPISILDTLIQAILKIRKFDNSQYVGNLLGYWGLKEVCRKSVFSESIRLPFEKIEANAPVGYDEWLRGVYGNYMKLPPLEKRYSHHLISYIDLNSSFGKANIN